MSVVRYLSVVDIEKVEEAKQIMQSEDEEKIADFFYGMGFDPKYPIIPQKCLHRPMTETNMVVDTIRFVSFERSDEEWVNSKYCTQENKLVQIGKKDRIFQEDLVKLSDVPNYTALVIEKIKEEGIFPDEMR